MVFDCPPVLSSIEVPETVSSLSLCPVGSHAVHVARYAVSTLSLRSVGSHAVHMARRLRSQRDPVRCPADPPPGVGTPRHRPVHGIRLPVGTVINSSARCFVDSVTSSCGFTLPSMWPVGYALSVILCGVPPTRHRAWAHLQGPEQFHQDLPPPRPTSDPTLQPTTALARPL